MVECPVGLRLWFCEGDRVGGGVAQLFAGFWGLLFWVVLAVECRAGALLVVISADLCDCACAFGVIEVEPAAEPEWFCVGAFWAEVEGVCGTIEPKTRCVVEVLVTVETCCCDVCRACLTGSCSFPVASKLMSSQYSFSLTSSRSMTSRTVCFAAFIEFELIDAGLLSRFRDLVSRASSC